MRNFNPEGCNHWPVVRLVTDDELNNPYFLADVQDFAGKLRVPRRRMVDWLVDGVRDARSLLADSDGRPVEFSYDELEHDHIELWFRDWLKRGNRSVAPRVRSESRERVTLVATMLKIIFPKESSVWGTGSIPRLERP
jgi:hypothetical protein